MSEGGRPLRREEAMRSLLFVPADSEKKLAKAPGAGADVLLVDLEDSVAPGRKAEARAIAADFLRKARQEDGRPLLYVRINAFDTGLVEDDLAGVMPARPDGILLPKAGSGADVTRLDAMLAVHEAEAGLPDGSTRIVALATETAASLFTCGSYAGSSPRLAGLTWGAEDLSADVGAAAVRTPSGEYLDLFRIARSLCVAGAVAAGVTPVDTVFTAYRDEDALTRETEAAARDGFLAKMAIHPAQVPVINRVFTPSPEAVERAQAVVAAFEAADADAGVVGVGGEMLDRPHLKRAERLLARAGAQA